MTPDQQELHDALLTKLFEVFDANCVGMNLDTGVKTINDFAAYTLYRMHKETNSFDLFSPKREVVTIHNMIEALMDIDNPKRKTTQPVKRNIPKRKRR